MTVTKEAFVDLEEKYNKVIKLVEEDSKLDPENDPHVSRHSARQILIGMKASIENLLRNQDPEAPEHNKLTAMLGAVYLYLGIIAISIENEEVSTCEKYLDRCSELVVKCGEKPETIMIMLNMQNQYGILWSQHDPDKSKSHLEKAEALYRSTKEANVIPLDISDLFNSNNEEPSQELALKNLEKVHTLTLYYLAQIYGVLKDALKSSVYCHNTLKRQLESNDYEPIDWALNSATLSQFFMEQNGFKQARHHLAASTYILDEHENNLNAIAERNEAYDAKVETFKHRYADVARCWVKYGLLLLSKSRERLLNHTDDIDSDCTISSDLAQMCLSDDSSISNEDLQNLYFPSLDINVYENSVTDQYILILPDAKELFLNIRMWLDKATSYYTLESLASDYIEIMQDQSQVYANLLFFYDSGENQAKLHKRRANILEDVVKELNPQYYLHYCRQIWFELAQIYSEILEIKMEKLRESNERASVHAMTKINSLTQKSISQFQNFIDSFNENLTNGSIPKRINKDFEKPYLQAHFHIAALHGKFITSKSIQISNSKETLKYYTEIVKYCERNPDVKELIPMELSICKEMVSLLPVKISKMETELSQSQS